MTPHMHEVGGFLLVAADGDRRAVASPVKRVGDVILSALLLVVLAPLFVVIAILVRLTSPGSVLFAQKRIGYQCREFEMYKFRTMVPGAEILEEQMSRELAPDHTFFKLPSDPRTTRFGRWLRHTSMDELPQLYNVLLGDMSLVGPRPLLVSDFKKFPKGEQLRRFAVKPGITGLWQVSGRNRLSDERRMELDVEYVEAWSHGRDLNILVRTLPAVLRGTGAF